MANIDHSPTAPPALAVFVPPQRRPLPRKLPRTPVVIDVHPGFPPPPPRPSVARTLVQPPQKKALNGYLLAGALLLTAVAAAVAFRAPLVGAVPQLNGLFTAIGMPVNTLGIETHDVAATRVWEGGWEQLRVTGIVENITGEPLTAPALELTILDADGAVLGRWEQAIAEAELAPGTTLPFTTDFPEPPENAAAIALRFGGGPTDAIAAPGAANVAVRYGDGTMQTTTPPPATEIAVRYGNGTTRTVAVPVP